MDHWWYRNGYTLSVYPSQQKLINLVKKEVKRGKRLIIPCSSIELLEKLKAVIKKQAPHYRVMTCSSQQEIDNYTIQGEEEFPLEEVVDDYDVVIYSLLDYIKIIQSHEESFDKVIAFLDESIGTPFKAFVLIFTYPVPSNIHVYIAKGSGDCQLIETKEDIIIWLKNQRLVGDYEFGRCALKELLKAAEKKRPFTLIDHEIPLKREICDQLIQLSELSTSYTEIVLEMFKSRGFELVHIKG